MRDWLTIELVLAVLLVTSFTCVGLLALWAATSPRHWFVRTVAVLAVLSPLLLVPACEPFLAFVLQAVVVVFGTRIWRWRNRIAAVAPSRASSEASDSARPSTGRFSMATLLWLTAAVAMTAAIGSRIAKHMPPLNLEAWTTIVLGGVLGGAAVLLGGWMVASRRKRLAWPAAAVLCALMGGFLAWKDWFVVSIFQQQWPPLPQRKWDYTILYIYLGTMLATSLATYVLLRLWRFATAREPSADSAEMFARKRHALSRFVAGMGFALLVLLTAAFPAFVLMKLLNPLPIPHVVLPDPNGWDDLVAAGKVIDDGSPILNMSIEHPSTEELATEIAKFSSAYDQIRLALTRPCLAPFWPAGGNFESIGSALPFWDDTSGLRSVARALVREAELAQQQGRFRDAASISIENIRVGQASTRGGVLIHYLIGIHIEGIGHSTLYSAVAHLDQKSCSDTIAALEQAEHSREPLDEVIERDRIWNENSNGWHRHLLVVLMDMTDSYGDTHETFHRQVLPEVQTIGRLLMVELALRQYQLAHDAWPDTLDELVPQYLREVPTDPFDAEGRPLRYKRSGEGYLLYSVGYDGKDDGGRAPAMNEHGYRFWLGDGDLRLDVYFAPEEHSSVDGDNDDGQ